MKRIAVYLFLAILMNAVFSLRVNARQPDSLYTQYNVFDHFRKPGPYGNRVEIIQSDSVAIRLNRLVETNRLTSGKMQGFRVRIFFDNKQTARSESEEIVMQFSEIHPVIPVYRVYENPYFKVTVGDFRTKSDAIRFMNGIRRTYPQAFITRETIAYPTL